MFAIIIPFTDTLTYELVDVEIVLEVDVLPDAAVGFWFIPLHPIARSNPPLKNPKKAISQAVIFKFSARAVFIHKTGLFRSTE